MKFVSNGQIATEILLLFYFVELLEKQLVKTMLHL